MNRSIRKRVGAGMNLRIDANEAWPAAEAAPWGCRQKLR